MQQLPRGCLLIGVGVGVGVCVSVCVCVSVSRLCHLQAVWLFSQESYPLCASVSLPVKQVTGQYLEGDTRQFASSPPAKATEVRADGGGLRVFGVWYVYPR